MIWTTDCFLTSVLQFFSHSTSITFARTPGRTDDICLVHGKTLVPKMYLSWSECRELRTFGKRLVGVCFGCLKPNQKYQCRVLGAKVDINNCDQTLLKIVCY